MLAIIAIVVAVLAIAAAVAAYLLAPKPQVDQGDKVNLEEFNYPTNDEDRAVPEIFGTVKVNGINCIMLDNIRVDEIEQTVSGGKDKQSQIVGLSYFADFAFAIGGYIDAIKEFRKSNNLEWSGNVDVSGDTFTAWTGKKSDISGSDASQTNITVYLGDQTSPDSIMQDATGADLVYPGISYIVAQRAFVGDNSASLEPYSVVVKRVSNGLNLPGWFDSAKADVNGGINPAHCLYYMINSMLGINANNIDLDSFLEAESTLYTEGIGLNFIMGGEKSAGDWIKEILRHIDGVVYFDSIEGDETVRGKFYLKLIRTPDIETLTELDSSKIKDLQFTRGSWENTLTSFTISYTDSNKQKATTQPYRNLAATRIINYEKTDNFKFMMFNHSDQINHVVLRMIRKSFYPLAGLEFKCSSSLGIKPGEAYKISHSHLDFSGFIARITEVQGDGKNDKEVTVKAVEDIFSISALDDFTITNTDANEFDYRLDGVSFQNYLIADSIPEFGLNPAIIIMVGNISDTSKTVFNAKVSIGGNHAGTIPVSATGTLKEAYDGDLVDDVGFTVENAMDVTTYSQTRGALQRMRRGIVFEDNLEVCSIQTVSETGTEGEYSITGIIRNLNGKRGSLSSHAAGTRVWFIDRPIREMPLFYYGNRGTVKIKPVNHLSEGSEIELIHGTDFDYEYGPETYYPPSNAEVEWSGSDVTISWIPCKRLGGANHRSADTIEATNDIREGVFHIYEGETFIAEVDGTEYEITGATPGTTYKIYTVGDARTSEALEVTI